MFFKQVKVLIVIRCLILIIVCLPFHLVYSQSDRIGHWKLYSSELVKSASSSKGVSHTIVKEAETEVVFNHKNPTFERRSGGGKYSDLPVGYDMYIKYRWTILPTTLKPFDIVSTALSVVIEGNSRNAQDAVLNYSSRLYFVDLTKTKTVKSNQIPYSRFGEWSDTENVSIKGPKVSWSYNNQSYHHDQHLVRGSVRNNSSGDFTKMGVLVELSGFGYWLYSYVWSDEKLLDDGVEISEKIDIGGSYSSSGFPELQLVQNGKKVIGIYGLKNGRIEGELIENQIVGTWKQLNAEGQFIFNFNEDFTKFEGLWGYDESEPDHACNGVKL